MYGWSKKNTRDTLLSGFVDGNGVGVDDDDDEEEEEEPLMRWLRFLRRRGLLVPSSMMDASVVQLALTLNKIRQIMQLSEHDEMED